MAMEPSKKSESQTSVTLKSGRQPAPVHVGEAAVKDEPADSQLTTRKPFASSADTAELRHRRIADAAYYRARERGFEPGYELDDWLAAERQIEERPRPEP